MNGLKEVETILQSQSVLIKNKNLDNSQLQLLDKLLFRIQAVKKAKRNKYVLLNAPNENLKRIIGLFAGHEKSDRFSARRIRLEHVH